MVLVLQIMRISMPMLWVRPWYVSLKSAVDVQAGTSMVGLNMNRPSAGCDFVVINKKDSVMLS